MKLKLGAEFAENENGLAVLSVLLVLLVDPNWKGAAAGWLLTVDDPDPNSNTFFAWGSSPVGAAETALDAPPNGLLDPNAGEAAPNTGVVVAAAEPLPNAGAAVADC